MSSSEPSTPFTRALAAIDAAHSLDPRSYTDSNGLTTPYELHYAQKMTYYMNLLHGASPPTECLQLAIRAQHFRRWETPRSSYPMTKAGYLSWRVYLKRTQAEQASSICKDAGYSAEDCERIAALIRKEGLKKGEESEEEVQILEDAACLVFLEEQFDGFAQGIVNEEKVVNILRKTWAKMGKKGREAALNIDMSERGKELITKALDGA